MEIRRIELKDPSFPAVVRRLDAPPKALFVQGDLTAVLDKPRLGVVGTRRPTGYGQSVTQLFVQRAVGAGAAIISGLAYGVDGLAHQVALAAGGLNLAVLASGLDLITPVAHQPLAKEILTTGGVLVSQYPPGEPARRHTFVVRNRLIAALSDVLLIPEAAIGSGSRHTVDAMNSLGKPVMAIPGRIDSPLSAGANRLLRDGALVAGDPDDVIQALGLAVSQQSFWHQHTTEEQAIIRQLDSRTASTNQLLADSGLHITVFHRTLTGLELGGYINRLPGGLWSMTNKLDAGPP